MQALLAVSLDTDVALLSLFSFLVLPVGLQGGGMSTSKEVPLQPHRKQDKLLSESPTPLQSLSYCQSAMCDSFPSQFV
jgi:hypothetical protein